MTPPCPPAGHRWTTFSSSSRPNLYSALALHLHHDPEAWSSVRDEIRCKFTHHWICSQSPEYERCRKLNEDYTQEVQAADGLASQDVKKGHPLFTAAIQRGVPTPQLIELAADALDIRIVLHVEAEEKASGPKDARKCRLWIEAIETSAKKTTYNVSLLEEDGTGAAILSFLEGVRQEEQCAKNPVSALPIKKLTFCWKSWLVTVDNGGQGVFRDTGKSLVRANEYRGDTRSVAELREEAARYRIPRSREDATFTDAIVESHEVYTLGISDPQEISAAVDLLFQALEHACGQGAAVRHDRESPATAPLKPYVGVDAEFVKRSVGSRDYLGYTVCMEYVSVLTFAVDENFVLMFYLLEMLDEPTEMTVSAIHNLLVRTIFNKELLKIWHNFQSDVRVLEATIQLMYQQSTENEGDGYRPNLLCGMTDHFEPQPNPANALFQTARPVDVTFPRSQSGCNSMMHYSYDWEGGCPCNLLNVELAGVFAFVCNSLGIRDGAGPYRSWTDPRYRYNWPALIRSFMDGDRMQPLIEDCKDACQRNGSVDNFYQSLGSGMESNTDKTAYNVGDVIGIVRMIKLLTNGGDPDLLAMRLYGQNCLGRYEDIDRILDYHGEIQRRSLSSARCQMAHADALEDIARDRRSLLLTPPRLVPSSPAPRGRGRGYVSTLMNGAGRGRGRGVAGTHGFLIGSGRGRSPNQCIKPHVARSFDCIETPGLNAHEHDQRVLACRETVRRSLGLMPMMRALIEAHKSSQLPHWRKDETTWQKAVAEETHSKTFDPRSFRLPLDMLRQRAEASALANKLIVPASSTSVEELAMCFHKSHTTNEADDWTKLSSLLTEFCQEKIEISTRIYRLGEDQEKWERFVVDGTDELARCPLLDTRLDPKIYRTSSRTFALRQDWLRNMCIQELPRAEDSWQHETSSIVSAFGIIDPTNVFDRDGEDYRRRVEKAHSWLHANPAFPVVSPTKESGKLIRIYLALHKFAEDERKIRPDFTIEDDVQT